MSVGVSYLLFSGGSSSSGGDVVHDDDNDGATRSLSVFYENVVAVVSANDTTTKTAVDSVNHKFSLSIFSMMILVPSRVAESSFSMPSDVTSLH